MALRNLKSSCQVGSSIGQWQGFRFVSHFGGALLQMKEEMTSLFLWANAAVPCQICMGWSRVSSYSWSAHWVMRMQTATVLLDFPDIPARELYYTLSRA